MINNLGITEKRMIEIGLIGFKELNRIKDEHLFIKAIIERKDMTDIEKGFVCYKVGGYIQKMIAKEKIQEVKTNE